MIKNPIKYALLASALFLSSFINIEARQNLTDRFFFAYGYENITIDTTVGGKAFTTATVKAGPAQSVTFTVACASGTDCPIRMTLDGTAPTTSVGLRATYGQSVTLYALVNIQNFRAIREGATSAVINVQYFR